MWSIALETSSSKGSIALAREREVVEFSSFGKGVRHGKALAPGFKAFLEKHHLTPQNLSFLSVSIGPGSFTGIRVALALARGLALTTEAKIVGVSTFEALALKVQREKKIERGTLAVLMDARRGRIYGGVFSVEGGILKAHEPSWLRPFEEVPAKVPPGSLALGSGVGFLSLPGVEIIEEPDLSLPEAREVALLGWDLFNRREYDHMNTEPLYLMVTEAEEKLEKRRKRGK